MRDLRAHFASATASAHLEWQPYGGPYFAHYLVQRRTAGTVPVPVAAGQVAERSRASLVDSGLAGNTEYFYRVDVVTARGDTVAGAEAGGAIHRQLPPSWPLDLAGGDYVRLVRAEQGGVYATIAAAERVRMVHYGEDGAVLLDRVVLESPVGHIEPRSVALLPVEDGFLLAAGVGNPARLRRGEAGLLLALALDRDGDQVPERRPILADSLASLPDSALYLPGSVRILVGGLYATEARIFSGSELLLADDFRDGPGPEWSPRGQAKAGGVVGSMGFRDSTRTGLRVELRGAGPSGQVSSSVSILLGGGGSGRALSLALTNRVTKLTALFGSPVLWSTDPVLVEGLALEWGMSLGPSGGAVEATVSTPILWRAPWEGVSPFVGLAGSGESAVLVAGRAPYVLGSADVRQADSLHVPASEVRLWQVGNRRRLGLCLPADHTVAWASAYLRGSQFDWPFTVFQSTLVTAPEGNTGREPGDLLFPLSLDGLPDGRVVVLDAGNARLQVFAADGRYLTQWGSRGSGDGLFDFGAGRQATDFAGSVCVDTRGTIWVADVHNGRIQRFAP
ncbi:MAG: hypothetical protein AB1505_07040 [Candidatus Latescibacterota bacterium]